MKTKLTIEQSNRLIELGVGRDIASETEIYDEPCHRAYYAVFTITDLLAILPKKIEAEIQNMRRIVQLEVRWYDDCWLVRYSDLHGDIVDDKTTAKFAYELIDTLYELAVWCIENKYIEL